MGENRDQNVGRRIAFFRGDMPQAMLAEKMRRVGWKWSQSTVWAVEKGDRPVKLLEAIDLCNILNTSIQSLMGTESQAQADFFEWKYIAQLDAIREAIKSAMIQQIEIMQWADRTSLLDDEGRAQVAAFAGKESAFRAAEVSFVVESKDMERIYRSDPSSGELTQHLLDVWGADRQAVVRNVRGLNSSHGEHSEAP